MKLIVGLGNPGKEYENTRHNIGFMVVDKYLDNPTWQSKFKAKFTSLIINDEKVLFVKPETYMNLSGESIRDFVNFYKIKIDDILIIHDDLDLPFGTYRLKTNSSSGGHNGIKSIINCLGTNSFARLKIGISHNANGDTKDFVLGKLSKEQLESLDSLYPKFNNIINAFLKENINKVMNDYNGAQ